MSKCFAPTQEIVLYIWTQSIARRGWDGMERHAPLCDTYRSPSFEVLNQESVSDMCCNMNNVTIPVNVTPFTIVHPLGLSDNAQSGIPRLREEVHIHFLQALCSLLARRCLHWLPKQPLCVSHISTRFPPLYYTAAAPGYPAGSRRPSYLPRLRRNDVVPSSMA